MSPSALLVTGMAEIVMTGLGFISQVSLLVFHFADLNKGSEGSAEMEE